MEHLGARKITSKKSVQRLGKAGHVAANFKQISSQIHLAIILKIVIHIDHTSFFWTYTKARTIT
jgi:hypothetical protein